MERKDFLRITSLAGFALAATGKTKAANTSTNATSSCVLIPTETAGPFPLDLTANSTFFRQDVRETKSGVQLNVRLKIIGQNNCLPLPNLRVNIWHCDKDGLYSGYSQSNNPGQAGKTYLRGYQMTDANGEVEFITIFPGWYSGRVCHIHFQVYVSSVYAAVSQLTFDVATKNAIYANNASLYTKGADPMAIGSDNVFSDGYNYQVATLTPNATTGGYDAYLEATIQGSGVATGLGKLEPETGGEFKLGQNYPNPYMGETTIPFSLANRSDIKIELWDLSGKKVGEIAKNNMAPGEQNVVVNMNAVELSTANYIYQLEVENQNGTFRQCKMMTALQ